VRLPFETPIDLLKPDGGTGPVSEIAIGGRRIGCRILNGRTVVVDWGQRYPVIYNVGPNGVLTGTWNNGTATETLVPN
jgi:hypothetical protein